MQSYMNLGGDSGVLAFEIGAASINVQFRDGSIYRYDYSTPGMSEVEKMKTLAIHGSGLNSFISKYVRKRYAVKLR